MRTDLAMEAHENACAGSQGALDGVIYAEKKEKGFSYNELEILTDDAARKTGKPCGRYVTMLLSGREKNDNRALCEAAVALSEIIRGFFPASFSSVLIAGLGNRDITADAIGPKVIDGVIVTRHIKSSNPTLYNSLGFADICAIAPGVLSQTGMESVEIVKSLVRDSKVSMALVIDALAARRLERLASTVQISDSGIAPGSGVGNNRKAINSELLGCPVLSIGVPTVVDAATLAADALESVGADEKDSDEARRKIIDDGLNFFVTPKETDVVIEYLSRMIALAVNLSLHSGLTADDALALMA